ncbi:MAG TPA: DHH family phosphoesterase [Candidatus Paceibacterota bacterium]|nr:DHH family phosphoesterase [Candidatus Paceibacterota bacterium]
MDTHSFEQFRNDFFQLVSESTSVVITAHFSPDDDSIASVLMLYAILTEKFPEKSVRIIYTGEPVTRYAVFAGFEKIKFVDDVANHLEGVDVLVMLDGSQQHRFSKFPEKLVAVPKTVAIDHHAGVPSTFTLSLVVPKSSSNAELIYHTFLTGDPISKSMAELILLGIIGDTGGLAHVPADQSSVFSIVKELIEIVGVSIGEFRSRYSTLPQRVFALLQEFVHNTTYIHVPRWPDAQYTFVKRSVAEMGSYSDEEMSAASHVYLSYYLPRITGYNWGFVISPRSDGECRMSSRSLPKSVNVRVLHERLGIGSGHDRAAGGAFKESDPEECIKKVLEWMKQNEPAIL